MTAGPPPRACAACGFSNRAGIRFCEECGSRLTLVCGACTHVNPTDYTYCEQCGKRLTSLAPPPVSKKTAAPVPRREPTAVAAGSIALGAEKAQRSTGPARPRRRRWFIAGIAAAVIATAIGFTAWQAGSEDANDTFAPGADGGGPAYTVADLDALIDREDFSTDPNLGVAVSGSEGIQYEFDGSLWTATAVGESGTERSRPGVIVARSHTTESSIELAIENETHRTWAEEILGAADGLAPTSTGWVIEDPVAFVPVLSDEPSGGFWSTDAEGSPILVRNEQTRFLFGVPGDDWAWAYDSVEDVALLVVVDDGESVVAGIVMDEDDTVRYIAAFDPAPSTQGVVDRALAELGQDVSVISAASGDDRVVAAPQVPQGGGVMAAGLPRPYAFGIGGWLQDKWNDTQDVGSAIVDTGWHQVRRGGAWTWENVIVGGVEHFKDEPLDLLGIEGTIVRILWDRITPLAGWETYLFEKDCHTEGPGPPGDTGRLPVYAQTFVEPPVRTGEPLPGAPSIAQQQQLLDLARRWMPGVKFSAHERCGEILRVLARVFPYDVDGLLTNDLARAERVEITYTVFFAEDGGRFRWLGTHPGDNEGFSIGLVRSQRTDRRCGMPAPLNFELHAAQSAAHKNAALGLIRRAHDDIAASDWAGECPTPGADDDYFVWVAENKHGIYFHESVCGNEVLWTEECEDGRAPYDLSSAVELFVTSNPYEACVGVEDAAQLCSGYELWPPCRDGDRTGDPDSFDLSDKLETYACAARGAPRHTGPLEIDGRVSWAPAEYIDYWVGHGFYPHTDGGSTQLPEAPTTATTGTTGTTEMPTTDTTEELVAVPNLYGMTSGQAESTLSAVGLQLQVDGGDSVGDSALIDLVVRQDIPGGGRVEPGRTISVWLGQMELVAVPDLGGFELAVAEQRVDEAGLALQVVGTVPVDAADAGRVMDQDPISGSVPVGSVIRVWLGEAEPASPAPPPPSPTGGMLRHDGIGGVASYCDPGTCPGGVLPFGVSANVPLDVLGSVFGAPDEYTDWIDAWGQFGACPGSQVLGIRWGALWVLMTDGATEYSSSPHFFGWTYDNSHSETQQLRNEFDVGLGDFVGDVPPEWFRLDQDPVYGGWFMNFGPNPSAPRSVAWVTGPDPSDSVTFMTGGVGCGE